MDEVKILIFILSLQLLIITTMFHWLILDLMNHQQFAIYYLFKYILNQNTYDYI